MECRSFQFSGLVFQRPNRVELSPPSCITNINFWRSKFPGCFFNAPATLRGVVKCRGHISFHALSSLPLSLCLPACLSACLSRRPPRASTPPSLFHEQFIIFDTFQRRSLVLGGPSGCVATKERLRVKSGTLDVARVKSPFLFIV